MAAYIHNLYGTFYVVKKFVTFFSIRCNTLSVFAFTKVSPVICSYNSIYRFEISLIFSSDISGICCPSFP